VKEIGTIGHIRLPQHLSTMQAESRLRQALHKSVSHHLVCAAGQQLENLETHQFPKETVAGYQRVWANFVWANRI